MTATRSPTITPQSTAVEPLPSMRLPAPVSHRTTGTVKTITAIGATMFTARLGIPALGGCMATSEETIGRAPSRNSLPSSTTRRSASRMGPTFHPVTTTTNTRASATSA